MATHKGSLTSWARKTKTVPKKSPSKNRHPCQHLWVCGDVKNQNIPAVCKRCGEEAEFSPYLIPRDSRE